MPLTLTAINQKIFEALRDAAALKAECQARFGKLPAVFSGFTGEMAPMPEKMPYFQLFPAVKQRGEEEDKLLFTVSLELALQDSAVTEATVDGVYTAMYRGPASLEALLDLAMAAIQEISPDLEFDQEHSFYDPLEYYPLFVGVLTLTISFPNLIGGFEPTL
ncbi:MAG: hypothetical protein M1438_11630 [Deltaproteobacteria bacterium]|nr:hypothetical protein [Deltaproteobacteria bacterium]